ncbi:MAG: hypothetical protein AAGD01_16255 [Acidobacteriota bacterium]
MDRKERVVRITARSGKGTWDGSGYRLGNGLILTALHCIREVYVDGCFGSLAEHLLIYSLGVGQKVCTLADALVWPTFEQLQGPGCLDVAVIRDPLPLSEEIEYPGFVTTGLNRVPYEGYGFIPGTEICDINSEPHELEGWCWEWARGCRSVKCSVASRGREDSEIEDWDGDPWSGISGGPVFIDSIGQDGCSELYGIVSRRYEGDYAYEVIGFPYLIRQSDFVEAVGLEQGCLLPSGLLRLAARSADKSGKIFRKIKQYPGVEAVDSAEDLIAQALSLAASKNSYRDLLKTLSELQKARGATGELRKCVGAFCSVLLPLIAQLELSGDREVEEEGKRWFRMPLSSKTLAEGFAALRDERPADFELSEQFRETRTGEQFERRFELPISSLEAGLAIGTLKVTDSLEEMAAHIMKHDWSSSSRNLAGDNLPFLNDLVMTAASTAELDQRVKILGWALSQRLRELVPDHGRHYLLKVPTPASSELDQAIYDQLLDKLNSLVEEVMTLELRGDAERSVFLEMQFQDFYKILDRASAVKG